MTMSARLFSYMKMVPQTLMLDLYPIKIQAVHKLLS
jgi:hypothetical protein